jgi:hypothetical protein
VEVKLRIARAHIELGDLATAEAVLAEVQAENRTASPPVRTPRHWATTNYTKSPQTTL